jgi:hypothetical protein
MLAAQIIEYARTLEEGTLLSAKGLLHLGSRAAIDQALSRLAKAAKLMRVGRGRYVLPKATPFGNLAPESGKVIAALEAESGEVIVPHGIAAANMLGLTTQVPMVETYMSAGKKRVLHFGKREVRIQHAPRWQLLLPKRQAGDVIRALAWLGPKHVGEKMNILKRRLPESEWQALRIVAPRLPTWMAKAVSEVRA